MVNTKLMNIRNATYHDAPSIKLLLEALGYKTSTILLISQLEKILKGDDHEVFVYEVNKDVLGFISVDYVPQLGCGGELAIISYLSVDETSQGHGVGRALEEYVIAKALERKCDRVQVHCSDHRKPPHQFYMQQGYEEYPKYFTKRLIYGE